MSEKIICDDEKKNEKKDENSIDVKIRIKEQDKKKDKASFDKDKIEQAASIIQGMLINSEFVQFIKNENLDKKTSYDMNIVSDELLKKLDNKEELKIAELNKLKKVYYQAEDHEFEYALRQYNDEQKNSKDKFSANDIMYGIIMLRREQLREELESKVNADKVKEEIFINLEEVNDNIDPESQGFGDIFDGSKIIEEEKKEIVKKEDVSSVIKVLQANNKAFKSEMEKARRSHPNLFSQIETNFKKFNKKKNKERQILLDKILKNAEENKKENNEEEKKESESANNRQKVASEINKIKKEKIETNKDFFNGTADTRYELARNINSLVANIAVNNSSGKGYWANIIRTIENDSNKCGIPKNEQNLYSMLEKIQNGINDYTDIAGPLTEAFNIYKSEASKVDYNGTDLFKLNLLNLVVALINRVNELTKIVSHMWQYNVNEYKNNKQIAKLGNKGVELNKNAILFTEKKNASNSQFIPQDQWDSLPLQKKNFE